MIDMESPDYTWANLLVMYIKRLIDKTNIEHRDFSESEIVLLGLNILRIMCEIHYGDGTEDAQEWQYFFQAQKTDKDFQFFLYHLERMGLVKNTLLNEIINMTETEDIENFLKKVRGDD